MFCVQVIMQNKQRNAAKKNSANGFQFLVHRDRIIFRPYNFQSQSKRLVESAYIAINPKSPIN